MSFRSILFPDDARADLPKDEQDPTYFHDLNLDQFVDGLIAGKTDYDLRPFFRRSLATSDDVRFRQDVMRDLDQEPLFEIVQRFGASMRKVRETLALGSEMYDELQKQHYTLEAAARYCEAVRRMADTIDRVTIKSAGFGAFRNDLKAYLASERFQTLDQETTALAGRLATIRYAVTVYGGSLRVRRYDGEEDYSAEILDVFAKFREADAKNYLVDLPSHTRMDSVEARVLEFVAALHRSEYAELTDFVRQRKDFQEADLVRFDREIQFYVTYLVAVRRLREIGCAFCFPEIVEDKSVFAQATFDVVLAQRLVADGRPPITNDFELAGPERIIVVSGPNQGGKTTFARTFAQLHVLANLGLPVPGTAARLVLFDDVFTHFERQEHVGDARGKLEDELLRVHDLLERASSRSVVVLNEIFGSTTVRDATVLAERILRKIVDLDLLCVCVSFLDELVELDPSIVSMVSEVVPDSPTERTFKVRRRAPDGRSYAVALAEKHGLTSALLGERLARTASSDPTSGAPLETDDLRDRRRS